MPLIEVTMIEGRTPQQVKSLIMALTEAVESSIQAPRDSIRVVIREVPATHWGRGGVSLAEERSKG